MLWERRRAKARRGIVVAVSTSLNPGQNMDRPISWSRASAATGVLILMACGLAGFDSAFFVAAFAFTLIVQSTCAILLFRRGRGRAAALVATVCAALLSLSLL